MLTYIYALIDPDSDMVRYIGKSNHPKNRYSQHIYSAKKFHNKTKRDAWIYSLLKQDKMPILKILETVTQNWEEREIYYISIYQNLTNHTRGGDQPPINSGSDNPFFGKKHSEETRIILSNKGKERWNNGTLHLPPVLIGENNSSSKLRIFISPTGEIYKVYSFKSFCKKYNLSYEKCFNNINKGPIKKEIDPVFIKRQRKKCLNSIGWEIIDDTNKNHEKILQKFEEVSL